MINHTYCLLLSALPHAVDVSEKELSSQKNLILFLTQKHKKGTVRCLTSQQRPTFPVWGNRPEITTWVVGSIPTEAPPPM